MKKTTRISALILIFALLMNLCGSALATAEGILLADLDMAAYELLKSTEVESCDGEECGFNAFADKSGFNRGVELAAMYADETYAAFIEHVVLYHPDSGKLCICEDYAPKTHMYGTVAHDINCPWHLDNYEVGDITDIWSDVDFDKTDEDIAKIGFINKSKSVIDFFNEGVITDNETSGGHLFPMFAEDCPDYLLLCEVYFDSDDTPLIYYWDTFDYDFIENTAPGAYSSFVSADAFTKVVDINEFSATLAWDSDAATVKFYDVDGNWTAISVEELDGVEFEVVDIETESRFVQLDIDGDYTWVSYENIDKLFETPAGSEDEEEEVPSFDFESDREDGADLNIKIPNGTFGDDVSYIVNANEVAIDNQLKEAIEKLRAHYYSGITAFDISFADPNNPETQLQPAEGKHVELTFTVPTSAITGENLYVFRMKEDNTAEIVGSKAVDPSLEVQSITVQADSASIYGVMEDIPDVGDCSVIDCTGYFACASDIERYSYFMGELYGESNTAETMLLHLLRYHYDDVISNVCFCANSVLMLAPGSAYHAEDCPWYGVHVTLADHYAAYSGLDDIAKENYVIGLDEEVYEKLLRVNQSSLSVATAQNNSLTIDIPEGAFAENYLPNLESALITEDIRNIAMATGIIESVVGAYDISFVDLVAETKLQPSAEKPVLLTFKVPENGMHAVYHLVDNGEGGYSAEIVAFDVVDDNTLTVLADRFSIYLVGAVGNKSGKPITVNSTYNMTVGDSLIFYDDRYPDNPGTWKVIDEHGQIYYTVEEEGTGIYGEDSKYKRRAPWINVTALKDAGDVNVTLTYTYIINSYEHQRTETFYISVSEKTGFHIEDEVAESGCLVPKGLEDIANVTYTWTRSDNEAIREEALNEDGSVNISLDRGGVTNSRDPITYTLTASYTNASGNVITHQDTYRVLYGQEILNPSFESPKYTGTGNTYYANGTEGLYWKTTNPGTGGTLTNDVEIANDLNKYNTNVGKDTLHGKQFAEVNAEAFGALYQDMLTTSGATLTWSFNHLARTTGGSTNNTMYIIVGPTAGAQAIIDADDIDAILKAATSKAGGANRIPNAGSGIEFTYKNTTYRIWRNTADKWVWKPISGTYTVPEDQYLTRLMFVSDTAGKQSTLGNLIDAVSAGETMSYRIEYLPDGRTDSSKTESGNATVYTAVDLKNLQSYLNQSYVITGVTVNGKNYSLDANDPELYITNYGGTEDATHDIVLQIVLRKHALVVTKNVVIEGWDSLTNAEKTALMADYEAVFSLYQSDNKVASATASISYTEGSSLTAIAEFTKANGDIFTPMSGTYTIQEDSASSLLGYKLSATEFDKTSITLSNQILTGAYVCTNTYEMNVAPLSISKTVVGTETDASFNFEVSLPDGTYDYKIDGGNTRTLTVRGGKGPISLADGETAVIEGIVIGSNYNVEEVLTPEQAPYFTSSAENSAGTIPAVGTTAAFTNTYSSSSLTIEKWVKGDDSNAPNDAFEFRVTLPKGNYTLDNDTEFNFAEDGSQLLPVKLKHGESVTINGIPVGTLYTIVEILPSTGYGIPSVQVTTSGASTITGVTATGTVFEDNSKVVYTNTYQTGDLTITKQVVGNDAPTGDKADRFKFTLSLKDASNAALTDAYNWKIGETVQSGTVQNGSVIYLTMGQTATIMGLPKGARYIVTEEEHPDYTQDKASVTGTIAVENNATNAVEFTNTYKYGSLTIVKEVEGNMANTDDTFLFTVESGDIDMQIVIAGEGSVTIERLPINTPYTVTEDMDWAWRYTVNHDSQTATISASGNPQVLKFVNKLKETKWLDAAASAENIFDGSNRNDSSSNIN